MIVDDLGLNWKAEYMDGSRCIEEYLREQKERWQESLRVIEAIRDALKQGDYDTASELVQEHIYSVHDWAEEAAEEYEHS